MTDSVIEHHPYIPSASYSSIFPLYHPNSVDVLVFWEIPSQKRSGHLLVPGVSIGAGHAALMDIMEEAENAKGTRSMYAETRREKVEMLQAIMDSDWNSSMEPIVLTLQYAETAEHNFDDGQVLLINDTQSSTKALLSSPYFAPVAFTLRNHSLTHKSRFLLALTADRSEPSSPYVYFDCRQ